MIIKSAQATVFRALKARSILAWVEIGIGRLAGSADAGPGKRPIKPLSAVGAT
ncbi:MAG: hypothetical protein ACLQGT_14960 [Terracidiphilus sp.]